MTKMFPIQEGWHPETNERLGRSEIPWWLAEEAYAYYSMVYGTRQSLERLAERGGFGRYELLMLLRREKLESHKNRCGTDGKQKPKE